MNTDFDLNMASRAPDDADSEHMKECEEEIDAVQTAALGTDFDAALDDDFDPLEDALKFSKGDHLDERILDDGEEAIPIEPQDDYPKCDRSHCFSCIDGRCMALDNTSFGGKPCPFYKPFEEARREQKEAFKRLLEKGRYDLIRKYRKLYIALDIFSLADTELESMFSELHAQDHVDAVTAHDSEDDDWDDSRD